MTTCQNKLDYMSPVTENIGIGGRKMTGVKEIDLRNYQPHIL